METTNESKSSGVGGNMPHTSIMHSPRVHTSVSLVLILLAVFLFAQTLNALKEYRYIGGGVPSSNTVSVAGEGEVFAIPDTAEFIVSVEEKGKTASEVQQTSSEKITSIVDALKERGVEEKDIKTVSYELQPQYEWQPVTCVRYPCDRKQVQNGFMIQQDVKVMVRDMDKAGELLSLMTEKGASSVSALTFTVADESGKREEARTLAITDAKENAEKLANDLGVTLVRIVGFYEESTQPMPYMRSYMEDSISAEMSMAPKMASVPVGENQMLSHVTVTYEVR